MPSATQQHYPQIHTSTDFDPALHYHPVSPETHRYVPPSLPVPHFAPPVPQLARTPISNPMTFRPSHSVRDKFRTRDRDSTPHSRHRRTSKGKGRLGDPPMYHHMGAEGSGVSRGYATHMPTAYNTSNMEGDGDGDDDNGDYDREDDDGGGDYYDDGGDDDEEQMHEVDEIGEVGDFHLIAWWETYHSDDGGLALVREFQKAVEAVVLLKGFPSFRKGAEKAVNLEDIVETARENFEKNNPGQRALRESNVIYLCFAI